MRKTKQYLITATTHTLTLEQGQQEDCGIAAGDAGLGELGVVVALVPGLNEGQQSQHIVREGE